MRPDRRHLLLLGLCAAPLTVFGAEPADLQDETWHDPARRRDVPLRVRWPAGPPPADGWPVVLYSHGLGGTREGGAAWGQAWADAGLVVVHLQHAGSDLPGLRRALAAGSLAGATSGEQLLQRIGDVRFVLDEIGRRQAAGQGRWAAVRAREMGLAGHSFGAHTTLAVAGQRYPGSGLEPVQEPRVAAFIALSPTLPAQGDPRVAYAGLQRPLLVVTGTHDDDVVGLGATPDRRIGVYDALPPGRRARLVLQDADHMTFAGQPGSRLPWQPRSGAARTQEARHHALVASITTDWWRVHLLGDAQARQRLQQPGGLVGGDRWDAD